MQSRHQVTEAIYDKVPLSPILFLYPQFALSPSQRETHLEVPPAVHTDANQASEFDERLTQPSTFLPAGRETPGMEVGKITPSLNNIFSYPG